jgi:predicted kinase
MSGIAGSGKSSWIAHNYPEALVLSADHYRMEDGVYVYRKEKDAEIRSRVLRVFTLAASGVSSHATKIKLPEVVIVDNTNRAMFEIAPYYRIAEAFGHDVEIVRIHCDPEVAFKRGTHGVPLAQLYRMMDFEPLPSWWKIRHVFSC